MSNPTPLIGIVGGVGPYAGLDLAAKVFAQTRARRDQEHLPLALLSLPHTPKSVSVVPLVCTVQMPFPSECRIVPSAPTAYTEGSLYEDHTDISDLDEGTPLVWGTHTSVAGTQPSPSMA